eukprot:TRINITY_DN1006_c2_g1_i1.p1 TRINITY_DN1006_c2_g1~~TRINITY_DN1006_c2_g1_i1.p1  ORF type:complete len:573 (-),score=115.88 TRINITY_DN1006_c2_g1_i1:122-1840(-)
MFSLLGSIFLCFSFFQHAALAAEGSCNSADGTCAAGGSDYNREEVIEQLDRIGGCDLERIDAAGIAAKGAGQRFSVLRMKKTPFIIKGLTGEWPAHKKWQNGGFVDLYGEEALKEHPQVVSADASTEEMSMKTIKDYASGKASSGIMMAKGDWRFSSSYKGDVHPMPDALKDAYGYPVYSIGRSGTGISLHQHEETWMTHVVGAKVWILAPGGINKTELAEDQDATKLEGCKLLHQLDSERTFFHNDMQACLLEPGETIYLPPNMFHGTCNFGDLTVGIGGRDDSTDRPDVFVSIAMCDTKAFKAFLDEGEDLEVTDGATGKGILHMAADVGCMPILEMLTGAKKGDAKVDLEMKDGKRFEAVEYAAMKAHLPALQLFGRHLGYSYMSRLPLLAHVITAEDLDIQTRIDVTSALIEDGMDVALASVSPLQPAVALGNLALFKLIAKGSQDWLFKARASNGFTPLHMAAYGGHAPIVKWLLDYGLPADDPEEHDTGEEMKSIHLAAWNGHKDVCQMLVEARANPRAFTKSQEFPIDLAQEFGSRETVEYLFEFMEEGDGEILQGDGPPGGPGP